MFASRASRARARANPEQPALGCLRSASTSRSNKHSKHDKNKKQNSTLSSTETEEEHLPRHTQSALPAKLLSAKRVTFEDADAVVNSFPTEQALRQKESLKAKKEAGGAIQKRRQTVEAHSDDCGMDLPGIEADIIGFEQRGEDGRGNSSSSTAGDTDRLARWLSSRHWLFGSSAEDSVPLHDRVTACGCMETFLMQTRAKKAPGQADVVEIFGSRAETSRICTMPSQASTLISPTVSI